MFVIMKTLRLIRGNIFTALSLLFIGACLLSTAAIAHDGSHIPRRWEQATMDPDRIFLSFIGDPATTRAVTWRTDDRIDFAYAEIAESLGEADFDMLAKRVKAKTEKMDLAKVVASDHVLVHYHSVVFEGLKPDTLYVYRVGDGDYVWSEWSQFKTASNDVDPFCFVYFGDAQNDVRSRWARVILMAYHHSLFSPRAGEGFNEEERAKLITLIKKYNAGPPAPGARSQLFSGRSVWR